MSANRPSMTRANTKQEVAVKGCMKVRRFVPALLLLLGYSVMTRPLPAQSGYGQVRGRLTAVAGTPVSTASVALTSAKTEARVCTKSDAGGYFTVSNLAPDLYEIDIQADGFKRVQGTVAVSVDSTSMVDSTLQLGARRSELWRCFALLKHAVGPHSRKFPFWRI